MLYFINSAKKIYSGKIQIILDIRCWILGFSVWQKISVLLSRSWWKI